MKTNPSTGHPLGKGVVVMEDKIAAKNVIGALENFDFLGRILLVYEDLGEDSRRFW